MINIKRLKTDLGLTQTELSNLLGCSQSTVSAMERRGIVSQELIKKLNDKFTKEVVDKYMVNSIEATHITNIDIGNSENTNNNSVSDLDTLSIIREYQEMIKDLREDKQELRQTITELKERLAKYVSKFGEI